MTLAYKGIEINYNTVGKGTPLVFLHGFLENATMWDRITPYFSNNYTCITIDLLGHGKTDNLSYIHRMEDMAETVKAVLQILRIDIAILIGHSMGGYVALSFLDKFPSSVLGLVLLNSTSLPDSEERKTNRNRVINIIKKNPNMYIGMAIANLFAKENQLRYSDEIEIIKNEAAKISVQGIVSALEGMKIRKNHTTTLLKFKKPKIIFAGKKDPILTYQQNIKESQQSKTDLIAFDGGHMTYLENTDEFVKSLHTFLKNI